MRDASHIRTQLLRTTQGTDVRVARHTDIRTTRLPG